MFELGQLVARERRLRERALAYTQDLYAITGETVQLAVLDSGEVLYIEIIGGHDRVATPSRRGGRMPLHCTALGKAPLAFSQDGGRAFLEARPVLAPRTAHTRSPTSRRCAASCTTSAGGSSHLTARRPRWDCSASPPQCSTRGLAWRPRRCQYRCRSRRH